MRVLHIGLSSFPGGIENYVLTLQRQAYQEDVQFDYLDIYGDGLAFADEFERMGSNLLSVPPVKRRPLAAYRAIKRIIRERGYEKVHVHMLSAANPIPALAASRSNADLFLHAHNPATVGIVRKTLDTVNKPLLRRLRAKRLACSEASGNWMWGKRPFQVLVNTIETKRFLFSPTARAAVRERLGLDDQDILLGSVGRLAAQKNPLFLLEAFRLLSRNDRRYRLVLVGDGPLREAIRERANQYGLTDRVMLAGSQKAVEDYLSAMDLFLMPSLFEGFGIALVEAQASGLSCIVSDAIPRSAHVTDAVTVCSLESELWADAILGQSLPAWEQRASRGACVCSSPYDSAAGAKLLLGIYRTGVLG